MKKVIDERVRKEAEELVKGDKQFRYMLLNRMQQDCQAFIANGYCSHLWGITVTNHIFYMKALWKSFPYSSGKGGKPQWLKYGTILEYEREMLKLEERNR